MDDVDRGDVDRGDSREGPPSGAAGDWPEADGRHRVEGPSGDPGRPGRDRITDPRAHGAGGGGPGGPAWPPPPPPQAEEGPVWRAELDLVGLTFVPPPGHLRALAHSRLLLLRGEPGSGKRTAALHLMRDRRPDRVIALGPGHDLRTLRPKPRSGYLVDTADPFPLCAYTSADLEALRERLRERDAVLTATTTLGAARLGNWGQRQVDCGRPDPVRVLHSHLTYHLGEDWARRHLDLLDEEIAEIVRIDGSPARAAEVARELVAVAERRFPLGQVLAALRDDGHTAAARWLRDHPLRGDWALMIAAAVFEGHDYGIVAERAAALRGHLPASRSVPDDAGDWPPDDTKSLLRMLGAALAEDRFRRADGVIHRLDRIRFTRPGWGVSVRAHLWAEYPGLRGPVMDWLAGTPPEPDEVHRTAGEAAGAFLAGARGHRPLHPVPGWAPEGGAKRRLAVRALTVAARDPAIATHVRELLARWSGPGAGAEPRTTAACVYPGLAAVHPGPALDRLCALAGDPDPAVREAARTGVLGLWRDGMRGRDILDHLLDRLVDEGTDPAGAVAELTARLVLADLEEGGDLLASGRFATLAGMLAARPAGFDRMLRLFTDLVAAAGNEPGRGAALHALLARLSRPGGGSALERLAAEAIRPGGFRGDGGAGGFRAVRLPGGLPVASGGEGTGQVRDAASGP